MSPGFWAQSLNTVACGYLRCDDDDMLRLLTLALLLSCGNAFALEGPSKAPLKVGAGQPQHSSQTNLRPSEADSRALPVRINGPISIERSDKDRSEERHNSDIRLSLEKSSVHWSIAMAVATVLLVFGDGLLFWTALKQNQIAHRQNLSFERIERSYLFTNVSAPTNFLSTYNATPTRKVTINILNNGKTPAEVTQIRAYADIRKDVPQGLDDHPRSNELLPAGYGVASGHPIPVEVEFPMSSEEIDQVNRGYKTLYVVGSVTYKDIFSNEWVTSFCWFYRPYQSDQLFLLAPESKLNYRT